jgi:hypothetical protein
MLPPRHAYVQVLRLTYEKGGELRQFFKVTGLRRNSADWLRDEVPPFEGARARFVVEQLPKGKLRFVRQVD